MTTGSILIFGDSRSSDLRHHIPLGLADPAAYVEHGGARYVFTGSLELDRVRELGGLEVVSLEQLGMDKALAEGKTLHGSAIEAVARGCRQIGLREASTPADFPLAVAEALRREGIAVRADSGLFEERRRSKTDRELVGLRRAAATAGDALLAMRERLRAPEPADADELRAIARRVFADNRAIKHEMRTIISCGPQSAGPHNEGDGIIEPGQPIVFDIFPRDLASGCWADMCRTLCVGEPPERLLRHHAEAKEALLRATAAVRPGLACAELYRIAAEYLEERGHQTRLGKEPGEMPVDGFTHGLGHGVGLDVHEPPLLEENSKDILAPGDVIAIEPAVYYQDFGGVRLEDMVLVTESGHEVLTSTVPFELRV